MTEETASNETSAACKAASTNDVIDVAVIGAGPAGLTAGLYAARAGLNVVLFERISPGGQLAQTEHMENYPGFPEGTGGFELAFAMKQQADRFGASNVGEEVVSVDFTQNPKVLTTAFNEYRAKSVIIATGARPRKLGLELEEDLQGRGVSYCATCDGNFFRDKEVMVVGGGNTAAGAYKALVSNAALVTVYGRRQEQQFKKEMGRFDIIVNAVLWDPGRRDHIISRDDLKHLKRGALLIDVSCDEHGAIETSHPTAMESPIYMEGGIAHYCLDHSPSLFYRSASEFISEKTALFIKPLVLETEDGVLEGCRVIDGGKMILEESCR